MFFGRKWFQWAKSGLYSGFGFIRVLGWAADILWQGKLSSRIGGFDTGKFLSGLHVGVVFSSVA
ncbi:hypothetical protein ES705_35836 [subsurface metagenome]